jgi:hypothetical protein
MGLRIGSSIVRRAAAIAFIAVLAACSRITQENFAKVDTGMAEQDVLALLGSPTESNSVDVLGVSGTSSRWVGRDAEVTVRFVNGKVAFKSFDKPQTR